VTAGDEGVCVVPHGCDGVCVVPHGCDGVIQVMGSVEMSSVLL
jgi:hypothetical protein